MSAPEPESPANTVGNEASGTTAVVDETALLEARVAELEAQLAAAKDQLLRTAADLDNYRRRVQREKDELRRYAVGSVLEDLLPVVDGLALGMETARKTTEAAAVADGFAMVIQQFDQALTRHGLREIAPADGAFDPNQHEVLAMQPSAERDEGEILALIRKGYWLHDRLLRPATVVVSSGPQETAESAQDSSTGGAGDSQPGT